MSYPTLAHSLLFVCFFYLMIATEVYNLGFFFIHIHYKLAHFSSPVITTLNRYQTKILNLQSTQYKYLKMK